MGASLGSLCDVQTNDAHELHDVSTHGAKAALGPVEEIKEETELEEKIRMPEGLPDQPEVPLSPAPRTTLENAEANDPSGTKSTSLLRNRVPTNRGSLASSVNPEGIRISGRRESAQALENEGIDLRQRERASVFTMEGDIFGDYLFEEELGKGGFGTVFKGKHKKDGTLRAVKTINVQMTNPVVFQRELDQARKLKHPNIVRLLSHYRDDKNFYLVMELYGGGDLLTEVAKYPLRKNEEYGNFYDVGIPEEILQAYAWQMLSGLAYLHYHYIVHRDIKCENYMKTSPAEDAPIKLIDLGIAGNIQHTKNGYLTEVVGTISTMAPEVFTKQYTEKCDVWSLGVTLYICSICQEPWVFDRTRYMDEKEIMRALQDPTFEIPFGDRRFDYRSKPNVDLVKTMLTRNPQNRPRARELLAKNSYARAGRPAKGCCSCVR